MKLFDDDTIAAIATPPGPGGIGIIRISGPDALGILKQLFRSKTGKQHQFRSHQMYYGWIMRPENNELLDEVLVVFMAAPNSYTREDVVEIHCHGSFLILQQILAEIVKLPARLADPGEFTKRAFLNGRIDLTQAEAVLELLEAKTSAGLQMALSQLHGQLHDELLQIRQALLEVLAIFEVAIDFPDDDVEILHPEELLTRLHQDVEAPLRELQESSQQGRIYRDGISVVILGRPNVGKSSMLNRFLREERAIVTAIPGTTRDTIEEYMHIQGVPVRMVDTAGIRETSESVEEMGIQRARQKIEEADLILFLADASTIPTSEDLNLYNSIKDRPHLIVVNKSDVAIPGWKKSYTEIFPNGHLIETSTKTGEGLKKLEAEIFQAVTGGGVKWEPGHISVPNVRHRKAITRGLEAAHRAIDGLRGGEPPDLVAVDIQAVLGHLGDIVGESTPEDVLDVIFEQFCIGK